MPIRLFSSGLSLIDQTVAKGHRIHTQNTHDSGKSLQDVFCKQLRGQVVRHQGGDWCSKFWDAVRGPCTEIHITLSMDETQDCSLIGRI